MPAVSAYSGDDDHSRGRVSGRRLFERETFGGNGRTCLTCHGRETGTVSPADAQERFLADSDDPLFRGDGSDDGKGNGVIRMLRTAPYFHDNSAKTLEDVLRHYAQFFAIVTDPSVDGDPP